MKDWRHADDVILFALDPAGDVEYKPTPSELGKPPEDNPQPDPPLEAEEVGTTMEPARIENVETAEPKRKRRTRQRDERTKQNAAYVSYLVEGYFEKSERPAFAGSSENSEEPKPEKKVLTFHNAQPTQACEKGIFFI